MARPGRLITKQELLEAIWPAVYVADGALKVCVREIRRALHDDAHAPRFVETAHRRGYRFIAPVRRVPADTAAPAPENVDGPAVGPVRYARNGEVNIAYQVVGTGPIDLVFVMGWVSHLEYYWREPAFARFLRRLAGFSRLILFDKRGTGLSDPVTQMPTLEQRMDDVRAVLDAVGIAASGAAGGLGGGADVRAVRGHLPEPDRSAGDDRHLRAADLRRPTTPGRRRSSSAKRSARRSSRDGAVRSASRTGRRARRPTPHSATGGRPTSGWAPARPRPWRSRGMNAEIDIRHILPTVRVPALVLHRTGDQCLRVEEGRYVASLIPGARFVELPGQDHLPFVGDQSVMLDTIEQFLGGLRSSSESNRMLATILCAASRTAKRAAAPSVDRVQATVAAEAARFGGTSVQQAGDRVFAVFDGPARAIRCACAISAEARHAGMPLSVGLHTGECDRLAGAANGFVADIGARVASLGRTGDVLVSRTVVDLVAGSGLSFVDRGSHQLADGLQEWRVFAVQQAQDRC